MLQTQNLTISIGETAILRDINFHVAQNQVVALLGANGSGKTTLLKSLINYPNVTVSGNISFDSELINTFSLSERAKLGIKFTFQNPPPITGITLKNMINLALKRKPETLLLFDEVDLVKRFNLFNFLERDINVNFSGGERKRADLMLAILQNPKLLLLDEPDSGVDVKSLNIMATELNAFLETSKASAIIVTHQGNVLEKLSVDFAFVLHNGTGKKYDDAKRTVQLIKEKNSYDIE